MRTEQPAKALTRHSAPDDGATESSAAPRRVVPERTPQAAETVSPRSTPLGREVARRIETARRRGYSRRVIANASGLTQSVVARIQRRQYLRRDETEPIVGALDRIEAGEIDPQRAGRPATRATPNARLRRVRSALTDVPSDSRRVTEYREAIRTAIDIIDGVVNDADDSEKETNDD